MEYYNSNQLAKVVKNDDSQILIDLNTAKNYVVKSNDLIQKSKFELSAKEQKIILALIQQIRPTDNELYPVAFKMSNFCNLAGITVGGRNYKHFKDAIQTLADRSMWVTYKNEMGEEYYTLARWIEDPIVNPKTSEVYLKLNDKLKPNLLNLKSNFTQYNFQYTLPMKGMYSVRLYEILKSYLFKVNKSKNKIKINVDVLRELLTDAKDIKKKKFIYPRFVDFKRFVIEPAMDEINTYTDIEVSVDFEKTGRSITDLVFDIKSKSADAKQKSERNVINDLNRRTTDDPSSMYGRQISFEEYNQIKSVSEVIYASTNDEIEIPVANEQLYLDNID